MDSDRTTGCRILVVEDEMLIASLIEEILLDLGCIVVGPVAKLDAALQLAQEAEIDAAILDVNIRDGQVFPAAELLLARGIPFVLASGYGDWALPASLRGHPRLTKPFTCEDIEEKIRRLCQEHCRRHTNARLASCEAPGGCVDRHGIGDQPARGSVDACSGAAA